MDNLLIDYYIHPQLVHDMSKIATEHSIATMDFGISLGVDTVALIGDVAGNDAPIMSPEHFEEYILPYENDAKKPNFIENSASCKDMGACGPLAYR